MRRLEVEGLVKRFDEVTALDQVSLAIEESEFFCVVGPSNAGKSTLLHTIAGLHRPDAGTVRLLGREVTALEPRDRRVGLLFQNNALFPTRSGFENIAFPLRAAGIAEAAARARVEEVAALLGVGHLLERPPRTFSGGEQQRVALGRALAHPCDLLMLDEPLTNLDARLRIALRIEFKALHRDSGQTFLYVTHDQIEAMSLSDRICVLDRGRVQQIGTPQEVYDRPANRFVAQFIGLPPMNLLPCTLEGEAGGHRLAGPGFELPLAGIEELGAYPSVPRDLRLGVRPEAVRVSEAPSEACPVAAEVSWVEPLGSRTVLDLTLDGLALRATVPGDARHPVGGRVHLGFRARPELLLDPATDTFVR